MPDAPHLEQTCCANGHRGGAGPGGRMAARKATGAEPVGCGGGDPLGRYGLEGGDAARVDLAEHVGVTTVGGGWSQEEVGVPQDGKLLGGDAEDALHLRDPTLDLAAQVLVGRVV